MVITVNKHSMESMQKIDARNGADRPSLPCFCRERIRARWRENDLYPFAMKHVREEGPCSPKHTSSRGLAAPNGFDLPDYVCAVVDAAAWGQGARLELQ
jgi:hypothetical protein